MNMKIRLRHQILVWKGLLLCVLAMPAQAQVGVGTTTPHPSAMMHISPGTGNNKGVILPSITSAQRMLLDSTQNISPSLIFFDKDLQKFYYFHQNPKQWFELDHDWIRKDVAGAGFVVGTNLYSGEPGNVGVGTLASINPAAKLTVVGEMVVGNATYTAAPAPPSNTVSVQNWVGIATRTPSAGSVLDVKGDAMIRSVSAQLDVVSDVVADRYRGTNNLSYGEGMVETGSIIMYYGTVSGNFVNGLGQGEYRGWALCDGRNNTPDLRGQFIVGSSNGDASSYGYINSERNRPDYILTDSVGYRIDSVGGAYEVTLTTAEMPAHTHPGSVTNSTGSHTHSYNSPDGCDDVVLSSTSGCFMADPNSTLQSGSAGNHSHTPSIAAQGGGNAHENRPPYYTLAYIIKLP
jgi:microcystin-dependent protein